MRYTPLCIVMFAAALTGCAGPDAVSESNFGQVLTEYHSNDMPCFNVVGAFPLRIGHQGGMSMNNALVESGLLDLEERTPDRGWGTLWIYTMTAEGEAAYHGTQEDPRAMGISERTTFCYGTGYDVKEIINYTEPSVSEVVGVTMARVSYRMDVRDLAPWATKIPEDVAGFRQLYRDLEVMRGDAARRATLVLTGNGWRHESEMF